VIGLKDICALLAAGSMGAGSVVAVQQTKKPVSAKQETAKPKKDRGGSLASRPRVVRPEPAVRPGPSILDCPVIGSPWGIEHQPTGLTPPMSDALLHLLPAVEQPGGGGFVLLPPSYSPAVPEPGAWAMFIAGLSLVGASLRKRRRERD
jgi:hypothetical protein